MARDRNLNVRIEAELMTQLKAYAKARQVSMAVAVRWAITDLLAKKKSSQGRWVSPDAGTLDV